MPLSAPNSKECWWGQSICAEDDIIPCRESVFVSWATFWSDGFFKSEEEFTKMNRDLMLMDASKHGEHISAPSPVALLVDVVESYWVLLINSLCLLPVAHNVEGFFPTTRGHITNTATKVCIRLFRNRHMCFDSVSLVFAKKNCGKSCRTETLI